MGSTRTTSRSGQLGALATVALWCSSFALIKHLVDAGLGAQDVAVGRFVVAWPGFVYLLWRAGGLPGLTRGEALRILVASAGGVTAYHLALNDGERTTASGVAALIVALAPAATLALALAVGLERFAPRRIAGHRARVRGRRGRRRAGLGRRLLAARPARAAARARRAAHVRALQRALQAAARPLRPAGADRCGRPRGLAAVPPVREHRCDRPLRRTRRGQLDRAGRARPRCHAGRLRDVEHRAAGARAVARDVVPLLRPAAGRGHRRGLPGRAGDALAAARRRARDRRCGRRPASGLHERRESRRLLASRAPTGNDVALEEAIFARGRGCDTRAARSPDARRRQPRNRPGAGAAERPAGLHAHGPARRQLEPALGARERAPAAARAHAGRRLGRSGLARPARGHAAGRDARAGGLAERRRPAGPGARGPGRRHDRGGAVAALGRDLPVRVHWRAVLHSAAAGREHGGGSTEPGLRHAAELPQLVLPRADLRPARVHGQGVRPLQHRGLVGDVQQRPTCSAGSPPRRRGAQVDDSLLPAPRLRLPAARRRARSPGSPRSAATTSGSTATTPCACSRTSSGTTSGSHTPAGSPAPTPECRRPMGDSCTADGFEYLDPFDAMGSGDIGAGSRSCAR